MTNFEQGYFTFMKVAGLGDQAFKLVTSPFRLAGNVMEQGWFRGTGALTRAAGSGDELFMGGLSGMNPKMQAAGHDVLKRIGLGPNATNNAFLDATLTDVNKRTAANAARTAVLGAGAYGANALYQDQKPWHQKVRE